MKQSLIAITAILLLTANPSFGLTAQQEKMKTCNVESKTKGLAGPDRKTFMSECLSGKAGETAAATLTPQQEKMKTCNTEAAGKKGLERRKFMSDCLAAAPAAPVLPLATQAPTKIAPAVAAPASRPKPAAPVIPEIPPASTAH